VSLETRTAEIFSKAFTPFAVAAIISIAFSWFSPIGVGPVMSPLSSALVGIITLCLLPFAPVLYCVRTGSTDLDVSDATKRAPLYMLGLIGYALGVTAFLLLKNRLMFVMALAYLCVGLAMCLITIAWKISAHTAGIAGPITALALVFGAWTIPLYALSIFMMWSRMKLHGHTLSQAVAGLVVAIMITGIMYSVFYP